MRHRHLSTEPVRRRPSVAFVLVLACLLAAGCRSVMRGTAPIAPGEKTPSGLRYYLPLDVIEVKAEQTTTRMNVIKPDLTGRNEKKETTRKAEFEVVTLPDTSAYYMVDLRKAQFKDATLEVKLTSQGLLSSVNATTTGRVGDVVKSIGKIAGTVASLAALDLPAGVTWPQEVPACQSLSLNAYPLDVQLFVKRNQDGCTIWLQIQKLNEQIESYERNLEILRLQLPKMPANEVDAHVTKIKQLEKAIEQATAAKRSSEAVFTAKRQGFLKSLGLNQPEVTKLEGTTRFAVADIPPSDLIQAGLGRVQAALKLEKPEHAGRYKKAAELLREKGVLVTQYRYEGTGCGDDADCGSCLCAAEIADQWGGCSKEDSGKAARFFYRDSKPTELSLWIADEKDKLRLESSPRHDLIDTTSPPMCLAFKGSTVAATSLKLEFDARGRPTTLNRSSTAAAAGLAGAVEGGLTAARDAYAETLDKLVKIEDSKRSLELADLTTQIEEIKKQKELLDTQIAIEDATVHRDLVIEQKQLETQLAVLEARMKLQGSEQAYDAQLELARLKLEVERLKQELEVLKAREAIREILKGGEGG